MYPDSARLRCAAAGLIVRNGIFIGVVPILAYFIYFAFPMPWDDYNSCAVNPFSQARNCGRFGSTWLEELRRHERVVGSDKPLKPTKVQACPKSALQPASDVYSLSWPNSKLGNWQSILQIVVGANAAGALLALSARVSEAKIKEIQAEGDLMPALFRDAFLRRVRTILKQQTFAKYRDAAAGVVMTLLSGSMLLISSFWPDAPATNMHVAVILAALVASPMPQLTVGLVTKAYERELRRELSTAQAAAYKLTDRRQSVHCTVWLIVVLAAALPVATAIYWSN